MNLWTGFPAEISERLAILNAALLKSDDPRVVYYALMKVKSGVVRVPGVLAILNRALNPGFLRKGRPEEFHTPQMRKALSGATSAHRSAARKHLTSIRRDMGSYGIVLPHNIAWGMEYQMDPEWVSPLGVSAAIRQRPKVSAGCGPRLGALGEAGQN